MFANFYYEELVHCEEKLFVFSKCWNFVGFTEQVAEHGQFITVDIAGTSVVIQNFKGDLRALHNVCSHRFSIIQQEKCGKRALTCPYHGWTYDKNGVPFIPGNANFFQMDEKARQARALRNFSLEICGRFIFVRLSSQGPTLNEFLGENFTLLRHLSEIFVDPLENQLNPWSTNWKLGVESVLEVYHLEMVHPESFKNFVLPRWEIDIEGDHNIGKAYISEKSAKWWDSVRDRLRLKQSDHFFDYDHFFIFPNLAIGLSQGCLMSVQTYTPSSPETCELHFHLFMASSGLPSEKQAALRKAVSDNVISFNNIVLSEDQKIMEQVQKGTRQMNLAPVHGINESRIQKFHRQWQYWMQESNCLTVLNE
jgi:choline monooxygenase